MEWVGPLLIGSLVLLCALQLFWAHTISAIAEKTDQSELMQVLAWIPLLQLAPTLAAGGSSVGRFLAVTFVVLVGNGALLAAASILGSSLGNVMVPAGLGLSGLLCLFYFGRVASQTATARDLPGWLGLGVFIPVLNFFVYPYIAFHDGWVRPNKVGFAIGSVLILASTAPTFLAVQNFNQAGDFSPSAFLAMSQGNPAESSNAKEIHSQLFASLEVPDFRPPRPSQEPADSLQAALLAERQQASLRVLYQLKSRFDELDSLTANKSEANDTARAHAIGIIESIRGDLDLHRSELDSVTYADLGRHLLEIESRIESPAVQPRFAHNKAATRIDDFNARDRQSGPAAIQMDFESQTPRYGDRGTPPTRPFPVQASESCPSGTERHEIKTAKSDLEWCQQLAEFGGLRHGWYAKYLEFGQPESMGQYENGMRVGVWTRFYPTGEVRAQAEFEEGMQHGWVLTFDRAGEQTRSAWYQRGTRIPAR
jgi:hypothetical protein